MSYLTKISTKETPQSEKIPGSSQVANSAGGYAFGVDKWTRLRRFLILGSEGGSYYANERDLTTENFDALTECVKEDGLRTVNEIVQVSQEGLAAKNDPAIFALAYTCAKGDDTTKRAAFGALNKVCRIGTHLFHFAQYVEQFRGWGRTLVNGVASWYESKPTNELAYQAIKYRQRDGWSHRDLLRLSHPEADSPDKAALYDWITKDKAPEHGLIPFVDGFMAVQTEGMSPQAVVELAIAYGLPREALPTAALNTPEVWEALLETMPLTAMIRNLATMTRLGVIAPNSNGLKLVLERIADTERIQKARVHPLSILTALRTYASGQGFRGTNTWNPVVQVVDALNDAFYTAFKNVEPTGARHLLALDVSGSMTSGQVAGSPMSPREASAAMALVTMNVEDSYETVGFTSAGGGGYWRNNTTLTPLTISPKMRLDTVIDKISGLPFGGTDCALPMLYALENEREVDVFVVYTDSETWAGQIHPVQALQQYREKSGISAKLIVVGMVSNGFSIADPDDAGMLDVVGFDSSAPQLMGEFIKGNI